MFSPDKLEVIDVIEESDGLRTALCRIKRLQIGRPSSMRHWRRR